MQPGQQPAGLLPGATGFMTSSAFLGQPGQLPGMPGHAILAQRLAVLPTAPRGGLAAASQGFRAGGSQLPMGVMIKPPNRKGGASVKGRKSCNCKNSKCLKLYCECFASGRYCDNCNCLSCFNNKESEAVRQAAVEAILERNPNAFRPKIQTAEGDTHPQSIRNAPDGSVRHTKGCNCKKSSCLKKYCECFQGGIFCTEICKCVDCKNFDGSEARAQVISHHGDPFGMHTAVAAQQQPLKRPRMQLQQQQQQQLLQAQGLPAALMQQQLAAAVASGGAAAAALQPLQQLQALTAAGISLPGAGGLPPMSAAQLTGLPAPAGAAGMGAAGAAGLVPAESTAAAALPQLPARPPILDAVHELVKPELVDDLCSLLVLVAQEQADNFSKKQQQDQQDLGQQLTDSDVLVKPDVDGAAMAADGDAGQSNGLKRKREDGDEGAMEDAAAAKRAATEAELAAAGLGLGDPAAAADLLQQQQQQQQHLLQMQLQAQMQMQLATGNGMYDQGALSELYVAQEGVVLQEFNAILQRILSQADKKASSAAEAAAAAVATAEAAAAAAVADSVAADQAAADQAAAAAAAAAALYDGLGDAADPQQQQQLLQQMADQLQQQEQLQQHDIKPLLLPQQQQQALAAQQALLMQAAAANNNLALLQASRGLYLNTAQQQQQQQLLQPLMLQAAAAGGMGMQLSGLGGMRPNALQLLPVVAQDGSVHHVPAHTLMSLQLAAAGGLQQHQQQQGLVPQAAGLPQGVPAAATSALVAASAASAAAPAAQQISLLSLLNGTGTTSGNSP